jgi:site-specific DNA recombinase
MSTIAAALYARVSSDQQAQAQTIDSQLAALRERMAKDGALLNPAHEFIDAGYSGSTLIRPALEQLRDAVAAGELERVYAYTPDRLARKYAYQVMLVDEFQRGGVELVFLNHKFGQSPEDELLLQMQGMIAEYERAQILERSRRGKRWADENSLNLG